MAKTLAAAGFLVKPGAGTADESTILEHFHDKVKFVTPT
jgi:hypothetical protein